MSNLEDLISDNETILEAILETAVDCIITINRRGIMMTVNSATEKLFGYSKDELEGRNISMLMPSPYRENHDDYITNYISTGIKKIIGTGREVKARHKTGSIFPIYLSVSEVKLRNENLFTGIIRDISQIKEAEKKLVQLNKELERSNNDLEQFVYITSHDLREPLRKIYSFGKILSEELEEKLDDQQREYFDYMIEGTMRMDEMIKAILAYSSINTQSPPSSKCNILDILNMIITNNLEIKIKETKADIKVIGKNIEICGHKSQLYQLFQNLIMNAIKFVPKIKSPKIIITIKKKNENVKIDISDNGIGIQEKDQDKIFDMFKRLHLRDKYEGTGIGLTICKKVIENHNGEINVESNDKGTIFAVILPIGGRL